MTEQKVSRRDFLRLAGLAGATAAAVTTHPWDLLVAEAETAAGSKHRWAMVIDLQASGGKDPWTGCIAGALSRSEYLDGLTSAGFVDATVELTDLSPACPAYADHALVRRLVARTRVAVEPKQAWTDVARLAAHGVPAVNLGPGATAQAHQQGEWVELAALDLGYRLYETFLSEPSP